MAQIIGNHKIPYNTLTLDFSRLNMTRWKGNTWVDAGTMKSEYPTSTPPPEPVETVEYYNSNTKELIITTKKAIEAKKEYQKFLLQERYNRDLKLFEEKKKELERLEAILNNGNHGS